MRVSIGLVLGMSSIAVADPVPEPLWVKSVTATSTFADKTNAYDPKLTLYPKTKTDKKTDETVYQSAWCEGKKDAGLGEGITVTFVKPAKIPSMQIKAGVWLTQAYFVANNQPTKLEITTDDGRKFVVKPPAKREEIEVTIGGAAVTSVTVKIVEVKPGKMNDSCITELGFGESPAMGFDLAAANAWPAFFATVKDTFDHAENKPQCVPEKVAKLVDFPFTWKMAENTHGTNGTLYHPAVIKSAKQFEELCASGTIPSSMASHDGDVWLSAGPNEVGLMFEGADTVQTFEFGVKKGAWKLVTID